MGQGPIGLLLMMLARLAGATVLTSDPMPERRAVSERLGRRGGLRSCCAAVWRRKFAPARMGAARMSCWWPCRCPRRLPEALALARPGGRVLLFAQNDPHMKIEFPAAAVGVEEKEILGSYSAAVDRQEESARLVFSRALAGGRTDYAPVSAARSLNKLLLWLPGPQSDSLKVLIMP